MLAVLFACYSGAVPSSLAAGSSVQPCTLQGTTASKGAVPSFLAAGSSVQPCTLQGTTASKGAVPSFLAAGSFFQPCTLQGTTPWTGLQQASSSVISSVGALVQKRMMEQVSGLKRKLCALQKRIRSLEAENTNLRNGLKSYLNKDQVLRLTTKTVRGSAWSEGTVVKGLKVRLSCGSESYNVVRELVAPLPSERTLQRRLQQHKFPPGILIEMMKPLEVKVGLMSPAERHAVLMMDEIQLNEGLDYDATTGTVIGRPTIGLSSGKLPASCLATHGFVFMLGGMSTRWKQTVAYEFTENSFSAATVKTTIDTLIRRCEQIGIKVHALVTDMGGGNQALWRKYGILVGKHSKETCYANHPCDPARRLYFVADVPHLLKNLRNHLTRGQDIYLPDEVVRKNALPTDTVSIKQVEQLLELDEQSDMRVAPRLKKACISPGHYAKMKVGPAYTLFHHDTAAGLRYLVKLGRLDEEALTTAWFFEQVQRWFELMSSRTKVVAFSHKAQAGLDFLKDFITLFQDLAIGSRVRVWKPIQTGVVLSTTSAMELQTMMVGDHQFEYLLFSRLSQDALENLFSTIRLKNPVPRPKEFKSALRTVTLAQFLRPSSHGSYTKADGELLVGLENSAPEDPDPPPLQPGLLDLDTAEQDSFEYLCGYAVQQVKKNLKTCDNCSAAICAEQPMQDANDLVRLKSYTSNRMALVVPSKATLSLLEAAERYYRRNEKLVIDNSLSIHNLRSSILDATGPCEIPVCHDVPMKLLRCFLSTRLHMTLRKLNQQIRDKKQSAKCGSRSVGMRHAVVNI
uniref:Putative p-32 hm n=1 Tax=Ixodes ricinus TaxID=34613 RepID=A0A147BVI5_IXORI